MDFVKPDLGAPLDTAARLAALPPNRRVKGFVFQSVLAAAREGSGPKAFAGRDYSGFKDYPLGELISLVAEAAPLAYPTEPPAAGVRRLGGRAYETLRSSLAAKVILSFGGRELEGAVKIVSKVYAMISGQEVRVAHVGPGEATIELRDIWTFPSLYHAGLFDAAFADYKVNGEVRVRALSLCDVDLKLLWKR